MRLGGEEEQDEAEPEDGPEREGAEDCHAVGHGRPGVLEPSERIPEARTQRSAAARI